MKHTCKQCNGTGTIDCDECDGRGTTEQGIESVTILPGHEHFNELYALQHDARRVIEQAYQLKKLNPTRIDSYEDQLQGCLHVINKQANELLKTR